MDQPNNCPCDQTHTYKECCGKYHAIDSLYPETPEQLMRSRFSAFALGKVDYLINTLHPSKHQPNDNKSLLSAISSTQWLALHVLNSAYKDHTGTVEFQAIFKDSDSQETGMLHERSNFIKENGQWFYTDGKLFESSIPKEYYPSRNDPCWCGSGKKYKKCCGN